LRVAASRCSALTRDTFLGCLYRSRRAPAEIQLAAGSFFLPVLRKGLIVAKRNAPPAPRQEDLVGTWLLDSVLQFVPGPDASQAATIRQRDATGSLIYSPDGWMSVLIVLAARPQPAIGVLEGQGQGRGVVNYGYFGRYEVDWENRSVKHFVRLSMWPPENGRTMERRFELVDGRLTLDAGFGFRGERRLNRLVWRRAE
jgi:hypothetical protein